MSRVWQRFIRSSSVLRHSVRTRGLARTARRMGLRSLRAIGLLPPTHLGVPVSWTTNHNPVVTVVIIAENVDEALPGVLSRLQWQRSHRWECVVIDNGSLDRSRAVSQIFARADSRFRIVAAAPRLEQWQCTVLARRLSRTDRLVPIEDLRISSRLAIVLWRLRQATKRLDRRRRTEADVGGHSLVDPELVAPAANVVTPWPLEVSADPGVIGDAIVLVAEAEYHVAELGPLANELRRRGHRVEFMAAPRTTEATRLAIGQFATRIVSFSPDAVGIARAVVTLNDWGKARLLVESARREGVLCIAKVEGVQDFDDVDTGRRRDPYRRSDLVLAQGPNDVRALQGVRTFVVGSERLEKIWREPAVPSAARAIVNVNFTFGVLEAERNGWIRAVGRALEISGVSGLVSKHPADKGTTGGLPVTSKPFRFEASRGGVLISRFSTVPFEAMARGMEFIYFNPHGERVPTFAEPPAAFASAVGVDELVDALRRVGRRTPIELRSQYETFFRRQVDMEEGRLPSERAADVIERALG